MQNYSKLGLGQPGAGGSGSTLKRAPPVKLPGRTGPVWASVRVMKEHGTTPSVQCLNCDAQPFSAGYTRIVTHILKACSCETDGFLEFKDKLQLERDEAEEAKRQKKAEQDVDAAAAAPVVPDLFGAAKPKGGEQKDIRTAMVAAADADVDASVRRRALCDARNRSV